MPSRVTPGVSKRMAAVRQKDTGPELAVRKVLSALGHFYRVRNGDLPGSPDIANRSRRWAVFVHGCFWHRHGCTRTTTPKSNREFWLQKFDANVRRDRRAQRALRAMGFNVIVFWECHVLASTRHFLRRAETIHSGPRGRPLARRRARVHARTSEAGVAADGRAQGRTGSHTP